jgi:hypothetical protein
MRCLSEDPDFRWRESHQRRMTLNLPGALGAFKSIWEIEEIFLLELIESEWSEMFFVMVSLGFFTLTGDRYQMTIPRELKIETVKNAFRRIATTERRSMLEERFLITVTEQEAVAWKRRLLALGSPQRLADREALLAE